MSRSRAREEWWVVTWKQVSIVEPATHQHGGDPKGKKFGDDQKLGPPDGKKSRYLRSPKTEPKEAWWRSGAQGGEAVRTPGWGLSSSTRLSRYASFGIAWQSRHFP